MDKNSFGKLCQKIEPKILQIKNVGKNFVDKKMHKKTNEQKIYAKKNLFFPAIVFKIFCCLQIFFYPPKCVRAKESRCRTLSNFV